MKKHAVCMGGCLAATLLFFLVQPPEEALGAGATTPKRVLVVTVTKGFHHSSIATGEKVLAELAVKSGLFTVD